jgi:hypothetical protein
MKDRITAGHLSREGFGATHVTDDRDGTEILEQLLAAATPDETDHMVAASLQRGDEGAAERARSAGDEYAHGRS